MVTTAVALEDVLQQLRSKANPSALEGMARFGIPTRGALGGISTPTLKKMAREIGRDHTLAVALWKTGIHEARHLAAMVEDPKLVSEAQMELWASEFDSWDICDGCCLNLFARLPSAHRKAMEWSHRPEEFVKRGGFALMAVLAVHDKQASNARFLKFLPAVKRESKDERNFVKKAVNWALRQIGKRNMSLNRVALRTAKQIQRIDSRSARWIAADAIRELSSAAVQARLRSKRRRA